MTHQRTDALATSQHGLITRGQALALGISAGGIRHRVDRGHWSRVARGVFRLAGSVTSAHQRALAAVLAAGDGAALSHRSAAALHRLPGFSIEPLTVSVPRDRRRSLEGVRLEESLALPEHHLQVVDAVPCTTVARTLFDLCGDVHAGRAERALDTALARCMVTVPTLRRMLDDLAEHGRSGTVLLRDLLNERGERYVAPESELEVRLIELARRFGLPEPERQVDLGDDGSWIGRVDFVFRKARVVVEVDGAAFHDGLLDRRHDEDRDARLRAAGWTVLRFCWGDVVNHPHAVAQAIRFQRGFA
jgi:very-short-patch-repair endonuclease